MRLSKAIFFLLRKTRKIKLVFLSSYWSFTFLAKKFIKSNDIVIFDCFDVGLYEHIFHYIKIIEEIGDCQILILTEKTNIEKVKSLYSNVPVIDIAISPYLLFVDLYVTPHVHISPPGFSYVIHVGHNQPIKYPSYPLEAMRKIDEHFVWGPLMMEYCKRMQEQANSSYRPRYTKMGNPRIDYEMRKDSNLLPRTCTVVGYAPSWDPGLTLRENGVQIADMLSKMNSVKVIVKLHPVSLTNPDHPDYKFYTGGVNWRQKFESLPNVTLFNGLSGYDYLRNIDIFVTDLSSFSFDAFLLDKKVIFFHTEQFWIQTKNLLYKNFGYDKYAGEPQDDLLINGGRVAGITVNNLSDLKDAIFEYSRNPGLRSLERDKLKKELLYNQGKSMTVARDRFMELLKSRA